MLMQGHSDFLALSRGGEVSQWSISADEVADAQGALGALVEVGAFADAQLDPGTQRCTVCFDSPTRVLDTPLARLLGLAGQDSVPLSAMGNQGKTEHIVVGRHPSRRPLEDMFSLLLATPQGLPICGAYVRRSLDDRDEPVTQCVSSCVNRFVSPLLRVADLVTQPRCVSSGRPLPFTSAVVVLVFHCITSRPPRLAHSELNPSHGDLLAYTVNQLRCTTGDAATDGDAVAPEEVDDLATYLTRFALGNQSHQ
ncbi:hypothetical protein HXX76_014144 [Chlamydomonas incerta]|uniref:Uncharacterized protein n=1 Tax=Chlamydomonas incerta TaxID=51695 RepID=A0A835SSA3_CHLIN|nr:hypothetical protein HXX76_014144 [Chlamydomonas incerta]|eukprot:KAG2424986.1 hypothetical protein HXX76_014144 [Chlamydomonas incerta]